MGTNTNILYHVHRNFIRSNSQENIYEIQILVDRKYLVFPSRAAAGKKKFVKPFAFICAATLF